MPDLNDRLIQTAGAVITAPTERVAQNPPPTSMEPVGTGFTRSPIPPIWSSHPDALRYFFRSGIVPQLRILTPSLKGS